MILDIFKIVFEADTGKADSGLKKAGKSTDDLIDKLEKTDNKADKAGKSLAGMAALAVGALTAILTASRSLSGAIDRAEDIRAIQQTADTLGEAAQDVDAFGRAMVLMGGDAKGARDSLTDMAESIGEAMQDIESGRAKTFKSLGVSLMGVDGQSINATEGLLRVSDAVAKLSKGEAIFRIKELGITDNRTVEAVLKGRKELERLIAVQKASNPLTKDQIKNAQGLNDALGAWRGTMTSAANSMFDKLIPGITKVIEWLTKAVNWVSEHKDAMVGFFAGVALVIATVYGPAMLAAAAATIAATWPLILIAAAVLAVGAAFALIYDDVVNYMEGNDSLIGQMRGALTDAFESFANTASEVFDSVGQAWDDLIGAVSSGIEWVVGLLKSELTPAFEVMSSVLSVIFEGLSMVWNAWISSIMGGVNAIKGAVTAVKGFFGFGDGASGAAAGNANIAAANANPMNSTTSSAISNSTRTTNETNVQVGQVTVQTQATDAKGISQSVGGELKGQLKQLEAETSSGVAR